jgi:alpha-glucosidase
MRQTRKQATEAKGRLAIAAMLLAHVTPAAAQEWSVTSPDGHNAIELMRHRDGRVTYRVARDGRVVVADSPLAVRRADQAFIRGLVLITAAKPGAIDEQYQTLHGKRRQHRVRANELAITFANPARARLEIVLRAHDDGVAFRYRFPAANSAQKVARSPKKPPALVFPPGPPAGCSRNRR